jgi:hypothetical protein
MGGGRQPPNPSSEVDVYDPATNTWSLSPAFTTARRNFPTDTDGTNRIWLSGGYDSGGFNTLATMEIFCLAATPTPTPTPAARHTPAPRPRPTPAPRP